MKKTREVVGWLRLKAFESDLQQVLLVALVVWVYWQGLWGGAPRADQLVYLHKIGEFTDFWDVLANSPGFNRADLSGDSVLYRPVLYLQLGIFYCLFHYDFFYWQLASLVIHLGVVLSVFRLLMVGALKHTVYPLILAAWFGVGYLGAELVLWHHISGYITFCLWSVLLVGCLCRYTVEGRIRYGVLAVVFGLLGEFTYELGVVVNLLAWAALLFSDVRGTEKRRLAWFFLGAAVAYPVASMVDLMLRGMPFPSEQGSGMDAAKIFLAIYYTLYQIGFWFAGWLFPTVFRLMAGGRTSFGGLQASFLQLLFSGALALGFAWGAVVLFARRRVGGRRWVRACLSGGMPVLFLLAYSLAIALGRALPRGIDYVLTANVYYAYIAGLAVLVAVALFFRTEIDGEEADARRPGETAPARQLRLAKGIVPVCCLLAVGANAWLTHTLARVYREEYSPPRLAVVASVANWVADNKRMDNVYFRMPSNCLGNDPLPWFTGGRFRRGTGWNGPATLVDVLFPEKSFALNEGRLSGQAVDVRDIRCPSSATSSSVSSPVSSPVGGRADR